MAKSYRVEVSTDAKASWAHNALRFVTREQAEDYARDLFARWYSMTNWRIAESDDEPNEPAETEPAETEPAETEPAETEPAAPAHWTDNVHGSWAGSKPCPCGSGSERQEFSDARGIFVAYACDACKRKKLSGYRPDIFADSGYYAEEPIEPEEY